MRKFLTISILIFFALVANAQMEIIPGSFAEMVGFVNNNKEIQFDDNDKPYSVIKMKTENFSDEQRKKLAFEGDARTFFEIEQIGDDVWIYLSYYATFIKISHPDMGTTEFWFPFDMEGGKGYEMTLVSRVTGSTGFGSLTITTTPEDGASIKVNGTLLSQTTPYSNPNIPAGYYNIEVFKVGFTTIRETVNIMDGEKKDMAFKMQEALSTVTIKTSDSTHVYIDDVFVTNGSWTGLLDAGKHKLECRRQYHKPAILMIDIVDNQVATCELLPEPIYGELTIETEPVGAKVFVDNVEYGTTPITINDILIGPHKLNIVRPGGIAVFKNIEMEASKPLVIKESMGNTIEGALPGMFSVSPTIKVHFSRGNLQYSPSSKQWRFAIHQWDVAGKAANGWIDRFAWGASGYKHRIDNYLPNETGTGRYDAYMDSRTNLNNHTGKADWSYNPIINGGNMENIWHTLGIYEWIYLFQERITPSGMRFVLATVNGVPGMILFPDDWNKKTYKLNKVNKGGVLVGFGANKISEEDWNSKFEANGAVFLPYCDSYARPGCYWSVNASSSSTEDVKYAFSFAIGGLDYISGPFERKADCELFVRPVCNVNLNVEEILNKKNNTTSYGYLEIRSIPTVADLTVNGEPYGRSPQALYNVEDGIYTVTFSRKGYYSKTKTIEIKDESAELLLGELDPIANPAGHYGKGVFTINKYGSKVRFSTGNLQYNTSTHAWQFAEEQWHFMGNLQNTNNWIDLFGWGTGENPTNTSSNDEDYSSFVDWGINSISGAGNCWFTLSDDEWRYLLFDRNTITGKRFVKAIVNNVWGLILLPDDWSDMIYRLYSSNEKSNEFGINKISLSDWNEKLQANGAVFLPGGGVRMQSGVFNMGDGYYWSANTTGELKSYMLLFSNTDVRVKKDSPRYGMSVRLVCPAK